jgi:hypothetical protein
MQKLYMNLCGGNAVSRALPPRPQAVSAAARAQSKQAAILSMGQLYRAKPSGGGCGSCGGAR